VCISITIILIFFLGAIICGNGEVKSVFMVLRFSRNSQNDVFGHFLRIIELLT